MTRAELLSQTAVASRRAYAAAVEVGNAQRALPNNCAVSWEDALRLEASLREALSVTETLTALHAKLNSVDLEARDAEARRIVEADAIALEWADGRAARLGDR